MPDETVYGHETYPRMCLPDADRDGAWISWMR
jgi:hypothetical protein